MFNSLFCYNKSGKNSNNDAMEYNGNNNSFPEFFDFGFGFGSFNGTNAENFFLGDSLFGNDFQSKNIFDGDISLTATNSTNIQVNNKNKNNNDNNIFVRPIKTSILNKSNFPEFVKPLPLKRFTKVKRNREKENLIHSCNSKKNTKTEKSKHCHNENHTNSNSTTKLIHQQNNFNKIKYEDIKCEIQANKYTKEILLESIHHAKSIDHNNSNNNILNSNCNSININSPLKDPIINEYQLLNNKSTAKKNNNHNNNSSKSITSNNNSNVTIYNESPISIKETSSSLISSTENNYLSFKEQKKININYNYLLQSFNVNINECSSVFEIQTFLNYQQHLLENQSKHIIKHLHFGPNPISLFIDWATWLKDEKQKKLQFQSRDLCNDLSSTLNSISLTMSSFPILKLPSSNDFLIQTSPERNKTSFHCQLCGYSFNSGQGLGGHMSRKHPDKSDKFKRKKFIREKRSLIREKLTEAKRLICNNHNVNYDELSQSKEGKLIIRSIIINNKEEFKTIYSKMKKTLNK